MPRKKSTSGKGTLKLLLTNLTIPFGGLTMNQVLTTDSLVRYEWEAASAATEFEPPDYGSFEIVSIRLQEEMRLVDERSISNCKLWKNSEMLDVLSDEQITAIAAHCEFLLSSNQAVKYVVSTKAATGKKMWYHEDVWRERALGLGYRVETVDKFREK